MQISYNVYISLCIRNLLKQQLFSVRKAGYRNLTLAVTAVADEKRLPEDTASVCLNYE